MSADLGFAQATDDKFSKVLDNLWCIISRIQKQDGRVCAVTFADNRLATHANAAHSLRNRVTESFARADASVALTREREPVCILFIQEDFLVDISEPLHHRLSIENAIQESFTLDGRLARERTGNLQQHDVGAGGRPDADDRRDPRRGIGECGVDVRAELTH
uniref:hypothetical protein n=1 Tax=Streptomyces bacillaris TaxID=68179 RepID=UPI0036D2949D